MIKRRRAYPDGTAGVAGIRVVYSAHLVQCSEPEPQYCNLRKERGGSKSGSLGDAHS